VRDRKRCVVIANGFFEWQKKDSKTKLPHFVKPKEGKLMLMAGLWDKAE
jgi:putative SOS response-associated peptidase YedK